MGASESSSSLNFIHDSANTRLSCYLFLGRWLYSDKGWPRTQVMNYVLLSNFLILVQQKNSYTAL